MTETQHPSELESAMDNLEALMEAVSVARQKVRDRRRRAVPDRAPRRPRPDVERVDWVRDGEDDIDEAEMEAPDLEEDAASQDEPWQGTDPLPPASAEVRQRMAEMAVQGRHEEQVQRTLEGAGASETTLLDSDDGRFRVYRAAAEEMVDANSESARQAREVVARSVHEDLAVHNAEGEALQRELADVQRADLAREQQAMLFAERVALVQEQQAAERADRAQQERQEQKQGTEFHSEIRLPLMLGGASLAATYGDDAAEAVQQYLEQELSARLDGNEMVVPVAGEGTDGDASVDPTVSAWRSVTAEELVRAAEGGPESANLAYLHGAAESALMGADGEVRAPGAESGQIRPTEDGIVLDAGVSDGDVSPVVWERLVAEFGEPEEGMLYVPVSADPHADPVAEIHAARADLPGSLFAAHEGYEQQLSVQRDLAEVEADPGVWVEPASEDAYVDLVEKRRPDGGVEAVVWVDEQQRPTTHPDGVPSVWFNEEGQPAAFGHYEDGNPSGTWAWTDAESGTFASDRAEMSAEGPVPGTQEHRESPEDGWTTVGEERGAESSGATSDLSGAAELGEVGLDAAPSTSESSPSPGPRRDPATPPMPDPSGPSRGPRLH